MNTYHSERYHSIKSLIVAVSIFIPFFIGGFVCFKMHAPGAVFITICSLPFVIVFIFSKKIKQLFTNKAEIIFDGRSITINEYQKELHEVIRKQTILLAEIKSYRFYFYRTNTTHIVIYMRDGNKSNFAFKIKENSDDSLSNENSILNIFHSEIDQYNLDTISAPIYLSRSFLNTIKGNVFLWTLAVLFFISISLHVAFRPSSSLGSLIVGVGFFLKLINSKNSDKMIYDKLQNKAIR